MSNQSNATVTTMGIDIGKNSFHVVGLDQRGAIVLRQKWSRGQIEVVGVVPPPLWRQGHKGQPGGLIDQDTIPVVRHGPTDESQPTLEVSWIKRQA
jgi:hypothetical protein